MRPVGLLRAWWDGGCGYSGIRSITVAIRKALRVGACRSQWAFDPVSHVLQYPVPRSAVLRNSNAQNRTLQLASGGCAAFRAHDSVGENAQVGDEKEVLESHACVGKSGRAKPL